MFYSGWHFKAPGSFDLSGRATAAGAGSPPASPSAPSHRPRDLSFLYYDTTTTLSHSAAASLAVGQGNEPAIVQRVEKVVPSASLADAPAAARHHHNNRPGPRLVDRGVVHLKLGASPATLSGAAHGRLAAARRYSASTAFHLRSDKPLVPQLGVAYMEVQLERRGLGTRTASDSATPPVGLVVGLCTDALPPHRLPGEENHSIGLFYTQSMVYRDGLGDGERVTLAASGAREAFAEPPLQAYFQFLNNATGSAAGGAGGDRQEEASPRAPSTGGAKQRRRELRVGDTLGVLVDFTKGTVRFTHNGVLIDGGAGVVEKPQRPQASTAPTSKADPTSYYFALGMQHPVASPVTLKVIFQSGAVPNPGVRPLTSLSPPPLLSVPEDAGQATSVSPYVGTDPVAFDVALYATREAERALRAQSPRLSERSWGEDGLKDAAVQAMLRQFFTARGLTGSLAALDREMAELSPSLAAAGFTDPAPTAAATFVEHSKGMAVVRGLASSPHRDTCFSPALVLDHHFLLPSTRAIFYAALASDSNDNSHREDAASRARPAPPAELLTPQHWGLLLFSRRLDLLFTLKAMQAAEAVLHCCEQYLAYLCARYGLAEALSEKTCCAAVQDMLVAAAGQRYSLFDVAGAAEARLLAAFSSTVLLPMAQVARQGGAVTSPAPSSGRHQEEASASSPSGHVRCWQDLANLSPEVLRASFLACLSENDAGGRTDAHAAKTAPPKEEGHRPTQARAETAAALLVVAAVPLLKAPSPATQGHIGEALVSFFSHTYAFFSQLTRGLPAVNLPNTGNDDDDAAAAATTSDDDVHVDAAPVAGKSPSAAAAAAATAANTVADPSLLVSCLRNWFALIAEARRRNRARMATVLQHTMEECNQWMGAQLDAWLAGKAAEDQRARERRVAAEATSATRTWSCVVDSQERFSEYEEDEEEEEEEEGTYSAPNASTRQPSSAGTIPQGKNGHGGEASALHRLMTAPAPPAHLLQALQTHKEDWAKDPKHASAPDEVSPSLQNAADLATLLPPGFPSLRALHRRCLARASLDPQAQVSTGFFLRHLTVSGRHSEATATEPHGAMGNEAKVGVEAKGGDGDAPTPTAVTAAPSPTAHAKADTHTPTRKRTARSQAGLRVTEEGHSDDAADAEEAQAAWATEEFHLASVYLQRVHRTIFQ